MTEPNEIKLTSGDEIIRITPTEEENEALMLMSEHAVGPPLTPATEAVLHAFRSTNLTINNLAAAIRAIAEHCVPDDSEGHWVYIPHVLAIAAELESTNNPSEND